MSSQDGPFGSSLCVIGVDLGTNSLKLAVLALEPAGLCLQSTQLHVHEGQPFEVLAARYRELGLQRCAALAATGLHGGALTAPALSGLPEDACIEAALDVLPELSGPQNFVRVGARGYSVLTRDATGRVRHVENDKCSARRTAHRRE